jgi:hypothetical protein
MRQKATSCQPNMLRDCGTLLEYMYTTTNWLPPHQQTMGAPLLVQMVILGQRWKSEEIKRDGRLLLGFRFSAPLAQQLN